MNQEIIHEYSRAMLTVSKNKLQNFIYLSCVILLIVSGANAQSSKPNIIFILGDDIGYKTLTINGGKSYSTPNLDEMAHAGMNFTQCHASPLCSPSRFMLLTGKYNFRNYTRWGVMDTSQRTFGNMFKNAGYQTACFGKWQLDGYETSIYKFGFDSYCVWNPSGTPDRSPRYKNPHIYTNGAFTSDDSGNYGEDIFADSVMNFMQRNKDVPFFIYYPMVLAHGPFQPTPEDADFDTWTSSVASDTSYYSSMIKYMDEKIGLIINKAKDLGIENNTVIIYTGDNGAPRSISQYADDDSVITGGKSTTTEAGTHVPLIIYWPGTVTGGSANNDLIDFTDFLPTLAGIANIPKPISYGVLDGDDFSERLTGGLGTPRSSIFYHYNHDPSKLDKYAYVRWAQTAVYKLYDTSSTTNVRLFYNIISDPNEKHPITDDLLTPDEITIKQQLLDVINSYIAQGFALFSRPIISNITDSSFTIQDSILINGGSTVTSSGVVWSTNPNPVIDGAHTTGNTSIGGLLSNIKGLSPNTTYYARTYAVNVAGIAYSSQITFSTPLSAPVANAASFIDSINFTANWTAVNGATSYKLDVSTLPSFAVVKASVLKEPFGKGILASAGWSISSNIVANSSIYATATPSVEFTESNAQIVTKLLNGSATQLKFWIKGLNTDANSSLRVEGFNGTEWILIQKIKNLSRNGVTKVYSATTKQTLPNNIVQFRFTYTKSTGTLAFDDVSVQYQSFTPSFVKGFNNLTVKTTSKKITGLKTGTTYYYRVRAMNNNSTSLNSNIVNTATCTRPIIHFININNVNCNDSANGTINVSATAPLITYDWMGPDSFVSTDSSIHNLTSGTYRLALLSNDGCEIDTNVEVIQPAAINATVQINPIPCAGGTTSLIVNADGGAGSYMYSLYDGTDTTGMQSDSMFTIAAGNYDVLIQDDNHCSFNIESIPVDEPKAIQVNLSNDAISCEGGTTIIAINATGGTGNYHYTLYDGTNTIGPQDDNFFIVKSGNYTITVTDDNDCANNADINIPDGSELCNGLVESKNKNQNNISGVNTNNLNISLFPNPSSNEFTLVVQSQADIGITIQVANISGQIIYTIKGAPNQRYHFGEQFKNGIYTIQVIQGSERKIIKAVKDK